MDNSFMKIFIVRSVYYIESNNIIPNIDLILVRDKGYVLHEEELDCHYPIMIYYSAFL